MIADDGCLLRFHWRCKGFVSFGPEETRKLLSGCRFRLQMARHLHGLLINSPRSVNVRNAAQAYCRVCGGKAGSFGSLSTQDLLPVTGEKAGVRPL